MARTLLGIITLVVSVIGVCDGQTATLPPPLALATPTLNVLYYASQEDVYAESNVQVKALLQSLQSNSLYNVNYTKSCALNVTYQYLPDNFNFTTVVDQYNLSVNLAPKIIAGSQYWLVSNILQSLNVTPQFVATYELPANIEAQLTVASLLSILSTFTSLAQNRSMTIPSSGVNLTLIFDQSVDLQFLTTLIGQLSSKTQFSLWTLYCPQLNEDNGDEYVQNLLTAPGIHFVLTSAATAVIILEQLTLESYTDFDFYNNIFYPSSDGSFDVWLFYNLTSFSTAASQSSLFQLVPAMVSHLESVDPAYVPSFCYQFFRSIVPTANPAYPNPSGSPQMTWTPSAPLAGGITQNQLRECEFALWLYNYYNQFCAANQNINDGNWVMPPFQNAVVNASSGPLTYDNTTGLRTSSRLVWRIGLTPVYDYARGQVQYVNNATVNYNLYPSAVNTLCQYSSNCPNSGNAKVNVTVSVPYLKPYYFVDNGVTYGYLYQITNLLAAQYNWNVNYLVTNATNFTGDWSGPVSASASNVTSGVVYQLQSAADIAIAPLLFSSYQQSFVVYTTPVVTTPFSVLMLQPNPPISWQTGIVWIFTTPFTYTQWVMFCASIVVLSILLTIIDNIGPNRFRFHFFRSIYYITARGVQGMAGISPNRWSSRLMVIFWGFTTMIFVQSYTANLTSTTIYQTNLQNAQPTTVQNLINSEITLGTVQDSLILSYLQSQNDSLGKMVYSAMSLNVESIEAGIRLIYERNGTIYEPYGFLYFQAVNEYYANISCGTLVSQPVFNSVELVFALPDSAFPKININNLNNFINNNMLSLINIFTNNQNLPVPQCNAPDWLNSLSSALDGTSAQTSVFNTVNLIGPFVLIVGGIGAAFGIIIFEFIFVSVRRIILFCVKRRRAAAEERAKLPKETAKERTRRIFREIFCFCCDVAKERAEKRAAKKPATGEDNAGMQESEA